MYQTLIYIMLDNLITILPPDAPEELQEPTALIQKLTAELKQLGRELGSLISKYLDLGYHLQSQPEESPQLEDLKEDWLSHQKSLLQKSILKSKLTYTPCYFHLDKTSMVLP